MEDIFLFKDLELQGVPLKDCELVYQDDYDNLRLYVLKEIEDNNFWAMLVSFHRGGIGEDGEVWSHPNTVVEKVLEVTAYWDGIRHLDQYYVNYPNVKKLSEVFLILADIEDTVCQETSRKYLSDSYKDET